MQEDYEESISLTLRTRNSKKPLRTLARNWKRWWLLLCLASLARKTSMERPVARLMISSLNLRVFLEATNPQECVWKELHRKFTKTILQEKGATHCSTTIWFTNLFLCLKQWRYLQLKTAVDKEWEKHVTNSAKFQGRAVFGGDIVKDDSGSYAAFTEQGSSASQMTAAKVTQIISSIPGCAGQAADPVSAYTQVRMEDAPKLLKVPKSQWPDNWIRPPRHKWPKSWSSVEDPVVPLERNLYGHPLAGLLWERQFGKIPIELRLGRSSWQGMLIRAP